MSSSNVLDTLERNELIQKLIDSGYGKFVTTILENDNLAFMRSNKLNKSSSSRLLNVRVKDLENILAECRKILGTDME